MLIKEQQLRGYVQDILRRAGASEEEAEIVSEELVQSNLLGVDSHGILRIPQYMWQIEEHFIVPGADVKTVKETPTTAIVDADYGFGHVAGRKTAEIVIQKAKENGVACAIVIHSTHIGRLGAYTERIARAGLWRSEQQDSIPAVHWRRLELRKQDWEPIQYHGLFRVERKIRL